MAETRLPLEGGCRCGSLRFQVTQAPLITMACHCRGCQRMTASAFSLSVMVPTAALEITQGETEIGGLHGERLNHHHCSRCKSWVFTRITPDPGFVNLRTTMLDDPSDFAPFIESCTDEKLAWATTPAKYSYPAFPSREDYGALMAEYAAR